MLNIHLGQAISKNFTGKERRTGMLRSSGNVHSFKFCCCGVFEVRRIRTVVSTVSHAAQLAPPLIRLYSEVSTKQDELNKI